MASCSSTTAEHRTPIATGPAITAADALFFSSQYGAARRAYEGVIRSNPNDPLAHAALALFDNYLQKTDAARHEAERAVALGPREGRAFAVLCRVHDWANRIDDALVAGRRGVALAPGDPLTHIFLSEVLADHAEADASRQEMARARALFTPRTPEYIRAELPREEANLAGGLGDVPGRLRSLAAAQAAQPRFMNRNTELISAHLQADDLPGASSVVAAALAAAPPDPEALGELGNSALLGADYGAARTIWARLTSISPRDPHVLEVAAHVAMATGHDPGPAEKLLASALAIDPNDAIAAGYLLALARYLRGDEAGGRAEIAAAIARSGKRSTLDLDRTASDHARAALDAVNAARARVGLGPVRLDQRLADSASAHAYYWLFNNASVTVAKLGVHLETPGLPGFRGATPLDRARRAGFTGTGIGEDITHQANAADAVSDWINSVYHRFAILRPDLEAIGYAEASVGPLPINDMEFGFGAAPRRAPVAYPPDGQREVPTSFNDNELPDPLPSGAPRVSGYPVTVTFASGTSVRMLTLTLSGPDGQPLDAYLLQPGPETENSGALLPKRALLRATRYTAHLVAIVDGARQEQTWSFVTK